MQWRFGGWLGRVESDDYFCCWNLDAGRGIEWNETVFKIDSDFDGRSRISFYHTVLQKEAPEQKKNEVVKDSQSNQVFDS